MIGRDMIGWDWEPSVVIGCVALAAGYFALVRQRGFRRTPCFLAGVLVLLLDLVSPLDTLADRYLFSAHVAQHFLLALVIPPLLLMGTPAFNLGRLANLERVLGHPPISWILGVGTMLVWHVPALFNAALASDPLHVLEHLSFLVTGTIFWWPILGPLQNRHLSPLAAVMYLFSACSSCTLLGAYLTFGPSGLYPAYTGYLGLDARADQQLGGLLMWVPGCFLYLSAILATVRKWYAEECTVGDRAA